MVARTGEANVPMPMIGVFWAFLRLGLTSFGGPTAHLGYFRRAFVDRRAWLSEADFASIVAFVLGSLEGRAGVGQSRWFDGLLVGLTAAAAAVVAQAVYALFRTLCTDAVTRAIAAVATLAALAAGAYPGFGWTPIALGAMLGLAFARTANISTGSLPFRIPRRVAGAAALVFAALAAAACVPGLVPSPVFTLLATIARAGTLVFGGGHVVLPLLHGLSGAGLVSDHLFFAGYGAVQAMPGPLFTFAAFLGAANTSPLHGAAGALIATLVIFGPSFALIFALAPAANAAVVGLLAAVLIDPMIVTLARNVIGAAIAVLAFIVISRLRLPPWIVVAASAAGGALAGALF